MKPLAVQVPESEYAELEAMAAQSGRPLTEVVRDLVSDFLQKRRGTQGSIQDVPAHASGPLLSGWSRADLMDEMSSR